MIVSSSGSPPFHQRGALPGYAGCYTLSSSDRRCGVALSAICPSSPSVSSNQLPYLTFLCCSLTFYWISLCQKKTPGNNPKPTLCQHSGPTRLWWHSGLPSSSHHYSCYCYLGVSFNFVHLYLFQKCQGQPELCVITMEGYRQPQPFSEAAVDLLDICLKVKMMTFNSLLEL